MFSLSLCQQFCPDLIPSSLGVEIGYGADGQTFSLLNDHCKVIKLSVLYEHQYDDLFRYHKQIAPAINYIIQAQPRAYVRVYAHQYLGSFSRLMPVWRTGKQRFLLYYYTMEKLGKISEDESKVFHTIFSHEDRGIKKDFSDEKIKEVLQGLNRGLDFDAGRVKIFYDNINAAPLNHLDLHPRNILKDVDGNFKAIDLDRCELLTLEKQYVKES